MPLLTSTHDLISVSLKDRNFNDTLIKQQAIFNTMIHRQDLDKGIATVVVTVTIRSYSNDKGIIGVPLNYQGVPDRQVDIVADNNCIVDATTGAILLIKQIGNSPRVQADFEAAAAKFTQNVMYQGDFFLMIRDKMPITIGDLLKQHILQAEAMGRLS